MVKSGNPLQPKETVPASTVAPSLINRGESFRCRLSPDEWGSQR